MMSRLLRPAVVVEGSAQGGRKSCPRAWVTGFQSAHDFVLRLPENAQ